jgi:23S rRNA (cytosine1962-C5)-methyltransferase
MDAVEIKLRHNHDHRVREGHPWVFSNEIDGDVAALPSGGVVDVFDSKGKFLGRGYGNPRSLIAVRILSRSRREAIDSAHFFAMRFRESLAYRAAVFPGRQSLRLIHAEGDGLPGLVVDRFGDVLSVQITTLGMETRKEAIAEALQSVFAPAGAVLRCEGRMREIEGLPDIRAVWFGEVSDEVEIDELGVRYRIAPLGSQKTGHFFDQAENRRFAGSLCAGANVLDTYCNSGGFGLQALRHGAISVLGIDLAAENLAKATENAALNGFAGRFETACGDGRTLLEKLAGEGQRFRVVMLDPPAFAKTRKVANQALKGYRDINALGAMLTEPGGFLVTSSCSYHVEEERFLEAVREGVAKAGRRVRLVRRGEQAPDHPVDPAIPETRYLKHYVVQVGL